MCEYDLAVTKTVVGNPVYEDGATVRYAVTVTNNGVEDMAVGDTVSLVDDLAAGGTLVSVVGLDVSVPEAGEVISAAGIVAYDLVDIPNVDLTEPPTQRERGLAAGASVEFVYDVVVAGTEPVTNVVSITDRGDESNNVSEATIDPAAPALALVKTADMEQATQVGEEITYSFVVTNTGNIELHEITIDEQEFSGKGVLPEPTCPSEAVAPGDSVTCTSVYSVVAADLTGEDLTNTATATAATPLGNRVESEEADAQVTTVKPVPAAAGLASTGGDSGMAGYTAAGALLLLLAGLALVVMRRSRSAA